LEKKGKVKRPVAKYESVKPEDVVKMEKA